MTQNQSGGIGSNNTQIGTVNIGLGYNDVKEIAKDIFSENFAKLASHAKSIVDSRAETIREEIIAELSSRKDIRLDSFAEPEKQVALLEAQKSYALSGDDELKGMLVRTVVEISKQPERSLKSTVLQEALKTLPQITSQQMKLLSLIFAVRYVRWGSAKNLDDLCGIFYKSVGGDVNNFHVKDGDFRHIQYCRCGALEVTTLTYSGVIGQTYPGYVSKGITTAEAEEAFRSTGFPPSGLMPALIDKSKLQIAASDDMVITLKSGAYGWSKEHAAISRKILHSSVMNDGEINAYIDSNSRHAEIRKKWDSTAMGSFSLTSVGFAIAHSYIIGSGLTVDDLNVWL